MADRIGKFSFGTLLIALGIAYILRNTFLVSSFLWTFLGSFLLLEGLLLSSSDLIAKIKKDNITNLFILFLGASILIIQLGILRYSNTTMFALALGSLGLASLISGAFFNYSIKNIAAGIVIIAIALLFFLPFTSMVSEKVQRIIRQFGVGILLIVIGIIIFLPSKKGE